MNKVSQLDLTALHEPQREEYLAVIRRVLERSAFIGGGEVEGFERELAEWVGGGGTVAGCANGTDAITLAALAMRFPAGSEAIAPAMTFIATIEGLLHAGLEVKLVDVDPKTWLLSPDRLESAIGPRTKLIVPVHLYGQMAEMDRIRAVADRAGCRVLEDAAQAQGARWKDKPVGGYGDVATYSFYPGKNLGAFGDAGAVQSRNAELVERVMALRSHGGRKKYEHAMVGFTSRLDGLQAAVLRVKLRSLERWNEARRRIAARYDEALAGIAGLTLPRAHESARHVYHQYVVLVEGRDRFRATLEEKGIETAVHYPAAIHQIPALPQFRGQSFPEAERVAASCVSLPMCPTLSDGAVDRVIAAVRGYFGKGK